MGTVPAFGNSSIKQTYLLKDENTLIGRTYYRLKEVDFDGYTEYFGIKYIDVSGKKRIDVLGNPVVHGILKLKMNFDPPAGSHATLVDEAGKSVTDFELVTPRVERQFYLNPGVYFLKIYSGGEVFTERLLFR